MLDDYALASDVGPQFGNVTVGSVKMTPTLLARADEVIE
jgi:hypothetical protein